MRQKQVVYTAWFQDYSIALNLAYNKKKVYKTLDYWSRDTLNFDFYKRVWE